MLDDALLALADPTRRAILARLAQGEATVNEIAQPFDLTQPAVSHHLKVLEKAGLIIRSRNTFKRSGTMQLEMENGGKLFFDLFVAMCNHMV